LNFYQFQRNYSKISC